MACKSQEILNLLRFADAGQAVSGDACTVRSSECAASGGWWSHFLSDFTSPAVSFCEVPFNDSCYRGFIS